MRLAIMQPYFLPYIGYFQLISAVDQFVIYDNIKYTKKGWINRNRMLRNGADCLFSLPLKKDSDQLDVVERELSPEFDGHLLLNQFKGAYRRAPGFPMTYELLEKILLNPERNLFWFIHSSVKEICRRLGIPTAIVISSQMPIDHDLKSQDKVLALCAAAGATTYLNPIGGTELYDREAFKRRGIELKFHKARPFIYPQFDGTFVPWLSIIDMMMFISNSDLIKQLKNFDEID